VLQIQNYEEEQNPYTHKRHDSLENINTSYWLEQIKATVAVAAELAVLIQ
jgi:hypothetical protein